MTPPIGFRTDTSTKASSTLIPIRSTVAVACDGPPLAPTSQFADYAYRVAALTAGLALLATFI
jgi:hypothetical protein